MNYEKLEQAARQALEALGEIEWSNNSQWQSDRAKTAITALREALDRQIQAPVTLPPRWQCVCSDELPAAENSLAGFAQVQNLSTHLGRVGSAWARVQGARVLRAHRHRECLCQSNSCGQRASRFLRLHHR